MFNLDVFTNENNKEHNLKWPYISDHPHDPYKILITGSSESGKANALLSLTWEQNSDVVSDKIYLYIKDLN